MSLRLQIGRKVRNQRTNLKSQTNWGSVLENVIFIDEGNINGEEQNEVNS